MRDVDEGNVEAIDAKALEAVLDRPAHAVRRIVDDHVIGRVRQGIGFGMVVVPRRLEQLADLGREEVVGSLLVMEKVAEPALR